MDTSKSVGLTDAPQPGSVTQAVFVGELCDRECAVLDHTGRTTVTEQKSSISSLVRDRERTESKNNHLRQTYCGDGQLPDLDCSQLDSGYSNCRQGFHGHGQLPDCERTESKTITIDRNTTVVIMASCLTMSVPS